MYHVALRKESVDRNRCSIKCAIARIKVALRKESVDRNGPVGTYASDRPGSLSARRAWIEISGIKKTCKALEVALRKESVDRNIINIRKIVRSIGVALRKESVDRNHWTINIQRPTAKSLSARRAWIEISKIKSSSITA